MAVITESWPYRNTASIEVKMMLNFSSIHHKPDTSRQQYLYWPSPANYFDLLLRTIRSFLV